MIEKIVDRYHADYFPIMGYEIDIVDGDLYYIKEHHEPIVLPKIWDESQEIKKSRYRRSIMSVSGTRKKYSRKYAFSSMCECG